MAETIFLTLTWNDPGRPMHVLDAPGLPGSPASIDEAPGSAPDQAVA